MPAGFHGRYIRKAPVRRQQGSYAHQLESILLPRVATHMGTPHQLAIWCTLQMGRPVSRQDVWRILSENNMTSKTDSPIPSLSVPWERRLQALHYRAMWNRDDMWVFADEKKFKNGDIGDRSGSIGYATVGERLNRAQMTNRFTLNGQMVGNVEVFGAIGVLPQALPIRVANQRAGQAPVLGHVGILASRVVQGVLQQSDILHFLRHTLCPLLGPYPGPRSVLVLDNYGRHRAYAAHIQSWVNARGAILLWNPSQSPDMNPIEKLWDVVLAVGTVAFSFSVRFLICLCFLSA